MNKMKEYVSPLTFADRILVGRSQIMGVSNTDPSRSPIEEKPVLAPKTKIV